MSEKRKKTQKISHQLLVVPSLTVFITSFCIMALELVAGRLIARYLGASLYTWTSVIGVVLGGITLGNYIGGRLADRFPARKTLACLFAIASATCVLVIILNNLVGGWTFLWKLSWPVRIFTHVCIVFLLPSTLLGTISPVVAKMALDRGLATGKTVGSIYAWGAAGSIAGTFAAGYYLIAMMGTISIVWAIAAVLLFIALGYWVRFRLLHIWAVLFVCASAMGIGPWQWAREAGTILALRKASGPDVIYEDETAYCYVSVEQVSTNPDHRTFMQDKLKHSEIIMDDVSDLQYFYQDIYAAITRGLRKGEDRLAVLMIGGGGYVFPRYIQKLWPGSRIDVAEIDPGVTEAAIRAFGLEPDSSIRTFNMDGRNYLDLLLERELRTGQTAIFDYIYGDAVNDYSVPYHLTTCQFNEKVAKLLKDDGVYMLNLIDIFDSGLFLGAIVNTLQETFAHVYVVTSADLPRSGRNTFVVIAAKQSLNVDELCAKYRQKSHSLWHLSEPDIQALKERTKRLVLTDDYAPVENLLSPVARADAVDFLAFEYLKQAKRLFSEGKFEACIKKYREVIDIDPTTSMKMYNEIGKVFLNQHEWDEAAEAFRNCLKYITENKLAVNTRNVHYNLSLALKRGGDTAEAGRRFQMAIVEYRKYLADNPDSARSHFYLARSLAETGNLNQAGEHFRKAVSLNPHNAEGHYEYAKNLALQGHLQQAIDHLRAAVPYISQQGQRQAATKLQQYLQVLESKQSQQNK